MHDNPQAHAARSLRNVSPSILEAMTSIDDESLRAMVAMINAGTSDPDVSAYAVTIAPRMWLDRRNDAPMVAIVRGAIRKAERVCALAAWDCFGDMADVAPMVEGDGARTTLSHYGTAPADSQYGVTYGDVAMTAIGTLPNGERAALRRASVDYVKVQRDQTGAGRPVTLVGATAYVEGWKATDSRYHAARRTTLGALRKVSPSAVLAVTGAPGDRPNYGTNRVNGGDRTPRSAAPTGIIAGRAPRTLPTVTMTRRDVVTVDYVWSGPMAGAGRVVVWDGRKVSRVDVRTARRHGWPLCDAMGYPVAMGYGAVVAVPSGEWRAVRESRETVATLPAVTVGGARPMLPPDVVTVTGADGRKVARPLSDVERAMVDSPPRVPMAESGDAPAARPDDSPLRGDVGANGQVLSGKVSPSPRKRPGGNTGPTVPARLAR